MSKGNVSLIVVKGVSKFITPMSLLKLQGELDKRRSVLIYKSNLDIEGRLVVAKQ
jgi:hypothetical protein